MDFSQPSAKLTELGNDMKEVFFQITVNCVNNIKDDMELYVQKDIEFLFSITILTPILYLFNIQKSDFCEINDDT